MSLPVAPGAPDPRLRQFLDGYPPDYFSDQLWRLCEWIDLYARSLAFELAESLDLLPAGSSPLDLASRLDALGFSPGFLPAARWLLDTLVAAGILTVAGSPSGPAAYRRAGPRPPASRDLRPVILAEDPDAGATLDLYDAAAAVYPAAARGEASGETALFSPATSGLWLRYFDNRNAAYAICNRVAAHAAAAAMGSQAAGLRVLELGGGVGGGGEALIDALRRRHGARAIGRYEFTEPSPFFRRRGERLLRGRFPDLDLATGDLDMTRDWASQGIDAGAYDLVFAVNVLHVAPDLGAVLAAARRALRPGGRLVGGECMPLFAGQPVAAELVFRLFHSFNAAPVGPDRPHSGFLGPGDWRRQFLAAGFGEVSIEPDLDRLRDLYPRFFAGAVVGRRLT